MLASHALTRSASGPPLMKTAPGASHHSYLLPLLLHNHGREDKGQHSRAAGAVVPLHAHRAPGARAARAQAVRRTQGSTPASCSPSPQHAAGSCCRPPTPPPPPKKGRTCVSWGYVSAWNEGMGGWAWGPWESCDGPCSATMCVALSRPLASMLTCGARGGGAWRTSLINWVGHHTGCRHMWPQGARATSAAGPCGCVAPPTACRAVLPLSGGGPCVAGPQPSSGPTN